MEELEEEVLVIRDRLMELQKVRVPVRTFEHAVLRQVMKIAGIGLETVASEVRAIVRRAKKDSS